MNGKNLNILGNHIPQDKIHNLDTRQDISPLGRFNGN